VIEEQRQNRKSREVSGRTASSGVLSRLALVRTDISEECSTAIIRVTRIGELGTTLTVTSNQRMLRRNTKWY
jgi:demethoxyubiquinone hydroxylase (CLK1/Coq7/Cat5 family)